MDENKIEKLERAGLKVKVWDGHETRYYVKDGSRDLGYLVDGDDGSTGTCKYVKRAGYIAGLLRG